jgi:hypothetical protein
LPFTLSALFQDALTLKSRRSSKTAETRPLEEICTNLPLATQNLTEELLPGVTPVAGGVRGRFVRLFLALLGSAMVLLAGCGGGAVTASPANATFSISPGSTSIDTNCTGCNATNAHGSPVHQFSAKLSTGGAAGVMWSVSGGDATAGAGTISAAGQYTPPSYLAADRVEVLVTAALKANPSVRATSLLLLTPGFLQPLTPENVALGANGTVTVTGYLAEAGGSKSIRFSLSDTATGRAGGEGSLGATTCQRSSHAFTSCSVTYTAPSAVASTSVTYVVAKAGDSSARTEAMVLLNTAGVSSNPADHQQQLAAPMQLGSSGGNNNDFDTSGNTIADCCSGTLGSLIQDTGGRQYLLSNNHVLARSDHAAVGDAVVQPGLIDNNCTPNGDGPGTLPVGSLTAWLPLRASTTNADAAIAQVASHSVDSAGSILELGTRQPDGSLTAAPPGISSTGGKGEPASLQLRVAKSGRTTGLTCGGVSALSVDVSVDYYRDCAETRPYLTKTFSNQIAISGDRFSDAGDSGALIVNAANAEPVGLFFAGGTDASGVGQGMANPASDVLSELNTQTSGASYTFVGTADHPVSCLSYGESTVPAAQARALSNVEIARGQSALAAARAMVNPSVGILGVAMGKSTDHPGEAAVIVYVEENSQSPVPATVAGVRTLVVPTNAHAVAFGSAPLANAAPASQLLPAAALTQALTVKRQVAHPLMQQNPAFFGVGVGQSLDNPREAALVIFVDRKHIPARLPSTVSGIRTRYVVMDRLHVTRSYATPFESRRHCIPHAKASQTGTFDPESLVRPRSLKLF